MNSMWLGRLYFAAQYPLPRCYCGITAGPSHVTNFGYTAVFMHRMNSVASSSLYHCKPTVLNNLVRCSESLSCYHCDNTVTSVTEATLCLKMQVTWFFIITLAKLNWFSKVFHWQYFDKIQFVSLAFSSHLNCVTTLPCKIRIGLFKSNSNFNSYYFIV